MDSDAIDRLRQLAYSAALDDALWPEWLGLLAAETGAVGGLFAVQDGASVPLREVVAVGRVTELFDDYVRFWGAHDPTIRPVSRVRTAAIFTDRDYSVADDPGHLAYRDWERTRHRLGPQLVSVATLRPGTMRAGFSLLRDVDAEPFSPDDLRRVNALFGDAAAAMQLGHRHAAMLEERFWDGAVATRDEAAALLLDANGMVVRASARVRALDPARHGLALAGDRLRATAPADDDALGRVVGRALGLPGTAGALRIRGRLLVTAYPLARARRMLAPYEAAALVWIVDPQDAPPDRTALYREAFGLTPREAALATLLMRGHSPESAAALRGVSLATIRSQLRALFEKTGTSRQSELVRLLSPLA